MITGTSRREFIAGATVAGAGLILRRGLFQQQAPAAARRRIDVHHHLISPAWKAQMKKWHDLGKYLQGYETAITYDAAKDIEQMDMGGVERSYLSVTTPGMWFGDIDATRRVVREQNEYGAKLVQQYKGRFGHFATVPLPDVDASLREICVRFRHPESRRYQFCNQLRRPVAWRQDIRPDMGRIEPA